MYCRTWRFRASSPPRAGRMLFSLPAETASPYQLRLRELDAEIDKAKGLIALNTSAEDRKKINKMIRRRNRFYAAHAHLLPRHNRTAPRRQMRGPGKTTARALRFLSGLFR